MAEIVGQRMSDYTDINHASELTSTEKAYYKANARVTTFGKVDGEASTPNSNYNIPLSEIAGEALPTIETGDAGKVLTVKANEDGVQWDTVDVLPEIDAEQDFQKVLTVAQGGNLEWSSVYIPTYYADEPITMSGYSFGLDYNSDNLKIANKSLDIKHPVPAPGTNAHRGEFLTVNNSDEVVWGTVPGLPDTTGHSQGDVLTIGVSGPDWSTPVHIPVIGTINITPSKEAY